MKLPNARWDDTNGVWFSQGYIGTDAATGKPVRKRKSFPEAKTQEEAQALSDKWFTEYHKIIGESVDGSLESWIQSYLNWVKLHRRPATYKAYLSRFNNAYPAALLRMNIKDIERWDVMQWEQSQLQKGVAPATARCAYQLLMGAFEYAINAGVPDLHNVAREARLRFEQQASTYARVFDKEEIDKLSNSFGKHDGIAAKVLDFAILTALNTGMRIGEICALTPEHVILPEDGAGAIRIRGSVTESTNPPTIGKTKNGKPRTISLSTEYTKALRQYMRWHDETFGKYKPVITLDGKLTRPSTISKAFSERAKELGLHKGARFHDLRHTHATMLLQTEMPISEVSRRLGHSSETVTMNVYSHAMPADDKAAAYAIGRALGDIMRDWGTSADSVE